MASQQVSQLKKELEFFIKFIGQTPSNNVFLDVIKAARDGSFENNDALQNQVFRNFFNNYDSDGSGHVDFGEFWKLLQGKTRVS